MYNQFNQSNALFENNLTAAQFSLSTVQTADSPVNRQVLDELTLGDADLLSELIVIYLEQFAHQLQELETVIENKDSDQLFRIAHKAVGGNATFGMNTVVPALRQLEKMGKEQQFEGAKELLSSIQNEFQAIRHGCQAILNETR